VRKSGRNPHLALAVGGKRHADPATEMWRALSNVNRDVKHFSCNDANHLALGLLNLVVEAAQDVLAGPGMVILDKSGGNPGDVRETAFVEALVKKAAVIAENFRLNNEYTGEGGSFYIHA
jgi:hypothetical protein